MSTSIRRSADSGATGPEEGLPDERLARIRQRPDGYHWIDVEGRQEFGPFDSVETALAEMDDTEGAIEGAIEQAESTEAVEQMLGIETEVDRGDEDEPEGAT